MRYCARTNIWIPDVDGFTKEFGRIEIQVRLGIGTHFSDARIKRRNKCADCIEIYMSALTKIHCRLFRTRLFAIRESGSSNR